MLIGYFEIPFEGKTFSAADQVVGVQGCGTPTGACTRHAPGDPRVDPYAGSWALDPWGQVVHRELSNGEVPLWNPYQGIGMPLAGNMQSSVFDPLLAVFHIHPTLLVQDLSFLVALLLVGLGGYAAARSMRLSPLAATVAGSVYGLSGWFFDYSNNHWFSIYVYLPFAIACIEWILRSQRRSPVVLLAVTMTATVFAGMPEPMFMSFAAIGIYALARLFIGPRVEPRPQSALRLATGAAIGLALAAPLLLLFGQYLPLSVNSHKGLADHPPLTDSPGYFLNWLMPKITPVSTNLHGYSRNWVGLGAVLLATVGVTSSRARRRFPVWPLLIVFAVLALQIYGGRLVAWTRFIPVWSQALWPNFGTPIIACVVALLAAVGVETLRDGIVSKRGFLVGIGVLGVIGLALVAIDERLFAVRHDVSFAGGWPLALLVGIALLALVLVARVPHRALIAVAIVVVEIVLLAPRGFYGPRESPYPSRSWLDYVTTHTESANGRVFSSDGTLFPDTAGVYGLSDLRTIDALYVDRYWVYLENFISGGILDRFIATGVTETAPNMAANPMFDILNVRYVLYDRRSGADLPDNAKSQYRLVFQGDGVKVYENQDVAPRAFVATDIHAAPDEAAALRFLRRGETVRTDGSVQLVVKDPRTTAVIEADPADVPQQKTCNQPVTSSTKVLSYSASTVKLAVDSSCNGLLVLGDEYYPGWSATVNGSDARIFATDVALRGVFVRAGHSIVEFRYRPSAFKIGIVLASLGVLAAALFLVVPVVVARRRRVRATEAVQ